MKPFQFALFALLPMQVACVAGGAWHREEALSRLQQEGYSRAEAKQAFDRGVDIDLQQRLARHESIDVRCALAQSPYVRKEVLYILLQDDEYEVRFCAAQNRDVPNEWLSEYLAVNRRDLSEQLRQYLEINARD